MSVIHYYAASGSWTVGTSPTDLMTIKAVSKPMYITTIYTQHSQGAGSPVTIKDTLVRRTSAPSGGANTLAVNTKQFTQSPSSDAEVRQYTTPPTAGGGTDSLRGTAVQLASAATTSLLEWPFADEGEGHIALMPGEMLAISTTGTPNGSTFYCTVRWHESI